MSELTREEILEVMCAPTTTDEPDESDFIASDEKAEEAFVRDWMRKELNYNHGSHY